MRFLTTDGKRITGWGSEPLAPTLVRDGLIVDSPKVASIIGALLDTKELTKSRVVSSIAGIRCLPRFLRLPKIERKMLEEAITYESERQMPLPLAELYIAWKHLSESNSESQIFVVGAPKDRIDAQVHTLDLAGLKSYLLDLKPIALARVVNHKEAIIIDLEQWRSLLILVADGVPLITRTLYIRGQDITVEDRIREVAIEVSRTVEFYNSNRPQHPHDSATPVFLTGKLASDPGVVDLTKAAISNPIETLDPAIEYPNAFPVSKYATNIGLAMKVGATKISREGTTLPALDLTIIPNNHRTPRSQKKLLLSSLVAVFLLALLFVTYQLDIDGVAESTDLRFKVENLSQQLLDARQTLDSRDSIESEIDGLREETQIILGSGNSFVEGLHSILGDIPYGVTPTTIAVTGNSITVEGSAATRSSAIDYLGLIEKTGDFSAVNIASLTMVDTESDDRVVQFTIIVDR